LRSLRRGTGSATYVAADCGTLGSRPRTAAGQDNPHTFASGRATPRVIIPPAPVAALERQQLRQRGFHAREGLAAVADTVLLFARQLAERPAQRRIKEDGIVAEAIRAARGLGDPALDRLLCLEDHGAAAG